MYTGKNRLVIAAAGSGKTTYLVHEALQHPNDSILITTYTEANEAEIRKKFFDTCGYIPRHVKVQTWFSFLIEHGVKPYQGQVIDCEIDGLLLVNRRSAPGVGERDPERYYLSPSRKIYSDKLAKLVIRCNQFSGGRVFDRMTRIFSAVFVDEVQDLAGYDLDILRALFSSRARVLVVGDPRQVVYLTHHEKRYEKYAYGKLREFITEQCWGLNVQVDEKTLSCSHRSHPSICKLSDQLYPNMPKTTSAQNELTGHDGVFLVEQRHLESYLSLYRPTQLRLDRRRPVNSRLPTYTFGKSKGLTFDRVVIYPTNDMLQWILDRQVKLAPKTRAQLYVALTRAKYSVAFLWDGRGTVPRDVSVWRPCTDRV